MFGALMLVPFVAEAVDRLCSSAEEADRVSSREYARATVVGQELSAIDGMGEARYVDFNNLVEVNVPGVGVVWATPNEARTLSRDPRESARVEKEFAKALAAALARRR